MVKLQIKLSKPDDLTLLNNAASAMPFDIDLSSGWYVADAKSLVGLFGLEISEPIGVRLYTDQKQAQPFLDKIGKMIMTH